MTSFSFFEYFDAFELDVNVVNFVHYGKTRMLIHHVGIRRDHKRSQAQSLLDLFLLNLFCSYLHKPLLLRENSINVQSFYS